MLAFALLAAATSFQFQVETAEFPNVVYHVGCLAENIPCTKTEIEKFWRDDLQWTSADQHQLDAWKQALNAVAARQPGLPESPFLPNYPGPAAVAVRAIIAAAFDSHSADGFRKRAATLATPGEILHMSQALEHFELRLRPWWKLKGERYAAARRRVIQSQFNAPDVATLGDHIVRFMEAETVSRKFHIHLIPRENPKSDAAKATYVGNHVLVELTDKMEPKFAKGVVMHEFTHSAYELSPLRNRQQLIRDFAAAPETQSQSLYAILNEGLATAVQFVLQPWDEKADQDVYRHPFIPRVGRAVGVPLAQALEHGPTLFHGFVDLYLRAASAELKDELNSPRFTLLSMALAPVGEMDLAAKAYDSALPALSWADFGERDRFPELNLVFLIPYDKLEVLAGFPGELVPLSQRHRGFAYASPRDSKGRVYVLAGRDDAAVVEVVKRFAAMRTAPAVGLVLSVD